jgi:SAM-dependent methyltransferase
MTDGEAARIRAEYARRAVELPASLYEPSRVENVFLHQSVERAALAALTRAGMLPIADRRILDVGCGDGEWLIDVTRWNADPARVSGIDLVPARVSRARKRMPALDIRLGDASDLPWDDDEFDIVLQSMTISSILDLDSRRAAAREMARVTRPGGIVLWYDFFVNPVNRNVRSVRKSEIRRLFPGFALDLRRTTLAPPLTRRLVPVSWATASVLAATHLLDTHYLATLRKPDSGA